MTTSTLQLACPTCGDEIEVKMLYDTRLTKVIRQMFDALWDYGARQAELATEQAGEP